MTKSADSDIGGIGPEHQPDRRPPSLSRYDLVLLSIPVAFVVAFAFGSLSTVSVERALVGAALFGVAVLADALFVNPPMDR